VFRPHFVLSLCTVSVRTGSRTRFQWIRIQNFTLPLFTSSRQHDTFTCSYTRKQAHSCAYDAHIHAADRMVCFLQIDAIAEGHQFFENFLKAHVYKSSIKFAQFGLNFLAVFINAMRFLSSSNFFLNSPICFIFDSLTWNV